MSDLATELNETEDAMSRGDIAAAKKMLRFIESKFLDMMICPFPKPVQERFSSMFGECRSLATFLDGVEAGREANAAPNESSSSTARKE